MRQVWLDDITAHYPPTLAAWRERFLGAWERLRPRGYDERFRRLWDFYLSLLGGGLPRAPDRRRAGALREAGVAVSGRARGRASRCC